MDGLGAVSKIRANVSIIWSSMVGGFGTVAQMKRYRVLQSDLDLSSLTGTQVEYQPLKCIENVLESHHHVSSSQERSYRGSNGGKLPSIAKSPPSPIWSSCYYHY